MKFTKYHALGNDYLVITPQEADELDQHPEVIQRICHRHYGIGSDGILWGPVATQNAKFGLRIFNPDGSEAEKSGNGIRIFSRWLWDQGLVIDEPFEIWTKDGQSVL
jgi:diaminopimelate epimerase